MKVNENILRMLTKVAEANCGHGRYKLASAIVSSNRIVSIGTNRLKTDPLQAKYGRNRECIFLHSEISAIKNALYTTTDFSKSDLYTVRVKRPDEKAKHSWVWGMAKPCEGCSRAIAEFGIRSVVYSTDKHGVFEII
jgi:deoxycytidylate deaminase